MDHNVPSGAAILLAFIAKTETGRTGREAYDVIFGHKQSRLAKPITSMTVGEVIAAQVGWSKNNGSSAAGAYQFIRKTLQGLIKEMGIPETATFSPNLQDRLAHRLLIRRGYSDFITGLIGRTEFGKRLAMEWASFPVLADTKGARRQLVRGQSFYAGDGLNKALVQPETVEAVLDNVKSTATGGEAPKPAPAPPVEDYEAPIAPAPPSQGKPLGRVGAALVAGIIAVLFGIVWFMGAPL